MDVIPCTLNYRHPVTGESRSESSRIHISHLACLLGFWCLAWRPHLSFASFLGQPGSQVPTDWPCIAIVLCFSIGHVPEGRMRGSTSDAMLSVGSPSLSPGTFSLTDSPTPGLPLCLHLLLPVSSTLEILRVLTWGSSLLMMQWPNGWFRSRWHLPGFSLSTPELPVLLHGDSTLKISKLELTSSYVNLASPSRFLASVEPLSIICPSVNGIERGPPLCCPDILYLLLDQHPVCFPNLTFSLHILCLPWIQEATPTTQITPKPLSSSWCL